jgi:redox-sensing transcriptional repressor
VSLHASTLDPMTENSMSDATTELEQFPDDFVFGEGMDAALDKQAIPDIVIGRLPVYLRTLKLLASEGQEVASSQELGDRLGISSAQIRKDLSHFGEFGKQGTGYNVTYLCRQLEKILKVDCIWPVVLVGAGYLGHALASYNGFENRGFRIVAVFDSDERKIGVRVGSATAVEPIDNIGETVNRFKCQIAIIAVPAEAAQNVADRLVEAGVKSILCYAPITLTVPKHIRVEYIDPVIHFQHMTFYLEKGCIDS